MPHRLERPTCGAPTRDGGACKNPVSLGQRCARHRLATEDQTLPPLDSQSEAERLLCLQAAAEDRALRAHQASDLESADKLDSVFVRNATLASNLARTRMALRREEQKTTSPSDEESEDDPQIIRLPDNGR